MKISKQPSDSVPVQLSDIRYFQKSQTFKPQKREDIIEEIKEQSIEEEESFISDLSIKPKKKKKTIKRLSMNEEPQKSKLISQNTMTKQTILDLVKKQSKMTWNSKTMSTQEKMQLQEAIRKNLQMGSFKTSFKNSLVSKKEEKQELSPVT